MYGKCARSLPIALTLASVVAATAARACDRPGTPNEVGARPFSATELDFGWTPRTHDNEMYYDIAIRDGNLQDIGRDLTGTGPMSGQYGIGIFRRYGSFQPNTKYCFRIRARTESGTKGCVSEIWSAWACATTKASTTGGASGPWSAVAANQKGVWGYAVGRPDQAKARADAVNGCGSGASSCTDVSAAQVPCIAYAESRQGGYWFGVGMGATTAAVTDVAMRGCSSGAPAGSCKLVKAVCR
jgi:hypothetical protein